MSAVPEVVTRFFSAWSERNPDLAVAVVTDDVTIADPYGTHVGSSVLHDHIEMIIRRFDFAPAVIRNCFVDGDLTGDARLAFIAECPMTGRSSKLAGISTGFEAAVFAQLRGGKIAQWNEYWDPAPLARALGG